jgi:hypothetical protein
MNRRRALALVSTILLAGCNGSASTGTGPTDGSPSDDTSSSESGSSESSSAPEAASEAGFDGTLAADSQPTGVDGAADARGDAADGSPDSPDGYVGSFDASDGGVQNCPDGGCGDGGSCLLGEIECVATDAGPGLAEIWVCDSTGTYHFGCVDYCTVSGCSGHGVCAPTSTQCWDNGVQTCTPSGLWGAPVPCVNQACVSGTCVGECAPGTSQCADGGALTCDPNGVWTSPACDGGACDAGMTCQVDAGQPD